MKKPPFKVILNSKKREMNTGQQYEINFKLLRKNTV